MVVRQLASFGAGLVLPRDPDDLLFRESRSFRSVRPFKGRALALQGGHSRGHVSAANFLSGILVAAIASYWAKGAWTLGGVYVSQAERRQEYARIPVIWEARPERLREATGA